MNASHTPGPWRIEFAETRARWPVICCDNDATAYEEGEIAEIVGVVASRQDDGDWRADPNAELVMANARLIVASPDLLAACKEFVRKCECGEARSSRSYQQMKAAIAKAEGQ